MIAPVWDPVNMKMDFTNAKLVTRKPRSFETRKKISETLKNHETSPEARQKMSQKQKALWKNEEYAIRTRRNLDAGREKAHDNQRGNPAWGERMREIRQYKLPLEEIKRLYIDEKMSIDAVAEQLGVGFGPIKDRLDRMGITRTFSESMLLRWQTEEFARKVWKGRQVKPNKSELLLFALLDCVAPGEWEYVGNGELVIGGKCPDFIDTSGNYWIIELFGDYWHQNEDPQDRVDYFANFGFTTLVIWESELKEPELVVEKIQNKFYEKEI